MSHYLQPVWKAIYDRAMADTGSGGLFNVGTPLVSTITNQMGYVNAISTAATLPYLVYSVTGTDGGNDGFKTAYRTVNFSIWSVVPSHESEVDTLDVTQKIISRLEGDWWDQSGGVPTFGFDRFAPTLSGTTWGCDQVLFERWRDASDSDGAIVSVIDFSLRLSKTEG